MKHIPVLLHEVIEALDLAPGKFIVDGTLGAGGHAREIIHRIAPDGTFLGLDRDERAVEQFISSADYADTQRVIAVSGSYQTLPEVMQNQYLGRADGMLLDLGFSSDQIDGVFVGRGFSFSKTEPLLMTYSKDDEPLYNRLKTIGEPELVRILKEYGEERYAVPIAREVVARRGSIETTTDLVDAIMEAVPVSYKKGRINPATKTFQALRIYNNNELEHLETLLNSLQEILAVDARIAIISFHSLEDRIVKNYFKEYAVPRHKNKYKDQALEPGFSLEVLTKKPITATKEEIENNPRSRSAKLRVAKVRQL